MRNIKGESSILTGMRCAAHTLQLSILDVIKTRYICQVLNKTRSIFKHLRKPNMQSTLKNFNVKKPCIDCVTRWGTTYDMINSFLKCQQFCEAIAPQNKLLLMSSSHWDQLKYLQEALEPTKVACIKLQSETLLPIDTIEI